MIRKTLMEQPSTSVIVLCHGWEISNLQSLYPLQKKNILWHPHVVPKFYGWRKLYNISEWNLMSPFQFYMKTLVKKVSSRIFACTRKKNIFLLNITFFTTTVWKKKYQGRIHWDKGIDIQYLHKPLPRDNFEYLQKMLNIPPLSHWYTIKNTRG